MDLAGLLTYYIIKQWFYSFNVTQNVSFLLLQNTSERYLKEPT